jgi:hypothetical protein
MNKIKTHELTGPALDWAAAMAEGFKPYYSPCRQINGEVVVTLMYNDGSGCMRLPQGFKPSSDWTKGGPIIHRELRTLEGGGDDWFARSRLGFIGQGPTPLIAAMRCFVVTKLGDEVEIPEEIMEDPQR